VTKLLVFETSLGYDHPELRAQGLDPEWAYTCREIGGLPEPIPPDIDAAVLFAEEVPLGETGVVDLARAAAKGLRPLVVTMGVNWRQESFCGLPARKAPVARTIRLFAGLVGF
jgi:hypothetical protein